MATRTADAQCSGVSTSPSADAAANDARIANADVSAADDGRAVGEGNASWEDSCSLRKAANDGDRPESIPEAG